MTLRRRPGGGERGVGRRRALPRAGAQAPARREPLRAAWRRRRGCGPGRSTSRSRGSSRVLDVAGPPPRRLRPARPGSTPGSRCSRPGLLDRAGQLQLAAPYDALATTPGLIVLGVCFVLDFVGDKVPAVDSLLHAVGSVVHPASGAILFAGPDRDADRRPLDRAVRARRGDRRLAARDARHGPPGLDHAHRRRGQPGALVRRGRRLARCSASLAVFAPLAGRAAAARRRRRRGAVVAPRHAPPRDEHAPDLERVVEHDDVGGLRRGQAAEVGAAGERARGCSSRRRAPRRAGRRARAGCAPPRPSSACCRPAARGRL